MTNQFDGVRAPALPIAPREYDTMSAEGTNKVLRIFFRRITDNLQQLVGASAGAAVLYFPWLRVSRVTDQTIGTIDTATAVDFTASSGLESSLVSDSRLTVNKAGEFLVSGVLSVGSSGSTAHSITVWLQKNGTDIEATGQTVPVTQAVTVAFTELVTMAAEDYIEVMCAVGSTDIFLDSTAASSPYPVIPSARAQLVFVSNG